MALGEEHYKTENLQSCQSKAFIQVIIIKNSIALRRLGL
jgi:hypothetical protein